MAHQNIVSIEAVRAEMNELVGRVADPGFITILQNTLAEFEYQGLSVLGIVQEIYRRGSAGGKAKEQIQEDISSMIVLFLSRGNNVTKMLQKTNEAGKLRIAALQQMYKLSNNVGGGGTTVITLSRVAAVFPVATLRILSNPTVAVPRAVTLPRAEFGSDFPRPMQTVIAAAIFPKGALGLSLMQALLLYLIEENKLLSNVAGMTDADILSRVIPYARASFVSSIVLESDRVNVCTAVGFLANGQLSGSLTPAINSFNNKYPNADLSFVS